MHEQELHANDRIRYVERDLNAPAERFVGLPPKWQHALLNRAATLNAKRGRVLSAQGSQSDICFGVRSGLVKLYHAEKDGKKTTLHFLSRGQWFGEFGLFQSGAHFTAEAMIDSSVAVVRKSVVVSLLQHEAGFGELLAQFSWQTTKALLDRLLSQASVEDKILWLVDRMDQIDAVRGKTLTQTEIGELSGVSRQRVNVALRQLIQEGRLRRSHDALSGYSRALTK
jgi:CRP/FNR family transcriptional regulator, cyclic AMP receptor protein